MKRIDILYGNGHYSVGGREFAQMQAEVAALSQTGGWLLVNDGEGARRDAYLWLSPGVPIALIPIPDPSPA